MTTPLSEAKAGLRREITARLAAMTDATRAAASLQICARLRQQPLWQSAQAVLLFAPLPDEPDIWPLLAEALRAGKMVALPRYSAESQGYRAHQVRDLDTEIQRGHFGIREPAENCPEIPVHELDFALVPGVAFDPQGGRLGRGKGYYDRLLSDMTGGKCGVGFDPQRVETVPLGPADVRLDYILTPTRWLSVRADQPDSPRI